jgi:LPXTG-motif cell wall-anchored protein
MKKSMMLALVGLMFVGGMTKSYAQDDSAKVAEEPKDTISIDNMDPVYYDDEETKESSNTTMYAVIGGIVIVGGAAYFFMKKKKK